MTGRRSSIRVGTLLAGGIALVWSLAFAGTYILADRTLRDFALEEAEAKAELLLNRNLATHTYFTHNLKPPLFQLIDTLNMPDDYFEPSWMSSTYAVREIDGYFNELTPNTYYYKEAAINARTPANEADAFERSFIEELNQDPSLTFESLVREIDGQPYFVTIRRGEQLEEGCLRCHDTPERAPGDLVALYGPERSFGREVGEVVSAISIRVPLADAYASAKQFSLRLLVALLVLLGVLLLAEFLFYRRLILIPLHGIRDAALLIATQEDHLGDQIRVPFGREFVEVANAFNSMSASLRRERNALVKSNRVKDEFIVSISHELRTPITNLKTHHYLIEHARDRLDEYLPVLQRETERLQQIIESVLDLSLLEQGQMDVSLGPVDLNGLVEPYVNDRRTMAEAKGLALAFEGRPDLPAVRADRALLGRVVGILLDNAVNFSSEGGTVRVRTATQDADGQRWIGFSVRDDGPGIPPDEQPRVFERFYRGSVALDTGTPGSGLGLAIAAEIVNRHAGRIEFESEGTSGKGSTFRVWLPVAGTPGG